MIIKSNCPKCGGNLEECEVAVYEGDKSTDRSVEGYECECGAVFTEDELIIEVLERPLLEKIY